MTVAIVSLAICILVIAFLISQLYSMGAQQRDTSHRDQECVILIARQLVKSATQSHPLFALEHASKAEFMLEDLERRHGNIAQAEIRLKLRAGKLQSLRDKVHTQHEHIQSALVRAIAAIDPRLDTPLNQDAGYVSEEESGELP